MFALLVGGSALAAVTFALDRPLIAVLIAVAATLLTTGEGAYRRHRSDQKLLDEQSERLRTLEAAGARLSFGRAVISPASQPIHVFVAELGGQPQSIGTGRVVRVPVVNRQGAAEAKRVHARITFLPDDADGQFSPREPAQGEWMGERGPEIEIDMPGNGRPRLLDVLLVLDGDYPQAHEWTNASRHAALRKYAILANPIEVEIEVMAAGEVANPPRIQDRLVIALYDGKISADWASRRADEPSNWVEWDGLGRKR